MTLKTSALLHSAEGATGTAVFITYSLVKSDEVELLSLSLGYAKINLGNDQDPTEPNKFKNKKPKDYLGLLEDGGLKVVLLANGHSGEKIELNLSADGKSLTDNPITLYTDGMGHLDHNQRHS